jgi:uncharacterized protein YdbL (DUF1318 family)
MKRAILWVLAGTCGMLAACAVITVNVYFPEKDVKQAYKSLDEMLLKQGSDGKQPATEPLPAGEQKKPEEIKPQSSLFGDRFRFSLVPEASAAETVADQLAVEISSMPEVLTAYDEMRARLPEINALRTSGAIGETKQGLVSVRDKAKLGNGQAIVDAENKNRKAVITGMAKAILKINQQPETSTGLNQVLSKAAASYATTRQEEAKPGWWIELPNGRWVQK